MLTQSAEQDYIVGDTQGETPGDAPGGAPHPLKSPLTEVTEIALSTLPSSPSPSPSPSSKGAPPKVNLMLTKSKVKLLEILTPQIRQCLVRWRDRLSQSKEFLNDSGDPFYQLAIVGGVALNGNLPANGQLITTDLDVKLVYNDSVSPDNFCSLHRNYFNPLRGRIILELVKTLNKNVVDDVKTGKLTKSPLDPRNKLVLFPDKQYFAGGINYIYPYLFYDLQDVKRCAVRYPKMIHMVFSVLYQMYDEVESELKVYSLVDISMFININRPDYLYNKPLNNCLYGQFHKLMRQKTISTLIPLTSDKLTAHSSFLLADLFWLSHLHHNEERRERAVTRMEILMKAKKLEKHYLDLTALNPLQFGFSQLKRHYSVNIEAPVVMSTATSTTTATATSTATPTQVKVDATSPSHGVKDVASEDTEVNISNNIDVSLEMITDQTKPSNIKDHLTIFDNLIKRLIG